MRLAGRAAMLAIALTIAAPAAAEAPLLERVETKLAEAGPGTRFGLVVATEDGRELIAINPDGRFIPASNTKMFSTAAAFVALEGIDKADAAGGAAVRLEDGRVPNVILKGHGDARLSSAPDCVANCLAALADAVAARTRVVGDVVGDDSLFPDQRWSPGMSWNNIQSRYGTATSALTIDDNEFPIRVIAGAAGEAPRLELLPYYEVDNRAVTVATGETELSTDRMPGSNLVRLTGTILAGDAPELLRLSIDDPAHFAAWRLKSMLGEAGVPPHAVSLSDGSGMSTYNRLAPRGVIGFLRWTSAQPWGAAWRETLPIAGVDGTLANRFKGTSLEKRLFAKTGTLNATNALSGYMVAKSGRTLFFSAYANDVPESVRATRFMDAALEMIAEAN